MSNRYQYIQQLSGSIGTPKHYKGAIYPEIPPAEDDLYLITTVEDRLDLLAYDYYNDASLWWVIASANSLPGNSLHTVPGTQIRIPSDVNKIISQFEVINKIR